MLISASSSAPSGCVITSDISGEIEFQSEGVTKAKVKANGSIESKATTGTPPLVVASTTVVPNLNSEMVGGQTVAALKKWYTEKLYACGTFHHEADFRPPSVWDSGSPDAYYPALDISAITGEQIIDSTGSSSIGALSPFAKIVSAPAVTWLRARKVTVRRGLSTEKSAFTLASYAVSGGTVCTLVFASDTDLVAALTAWGEDAFVAGASADLLTYTADFSKSWVLNIPTALVSGGTTVPAGDYALTSNVPGTRTVQITIPSTTNIGTTSTSVQCTFHPFRVPGAHTDQARIFASQGRVLAGANDGLNENISGGRLRGRLLGHGHTEQVPYSSGGGAIKYFGGSANSPVSPTGSDSFIGAPTTLSAYGPVRIGPENDTRRTITHIVFGLGELTA